MMRNSKLKQKITAVNQLAKNQAGEESEEKTTVKMRNERKARKNREIPVMTAVKTKLIGGTPITIEQAMELRQMVFGTAAAPPRGEWTRTPLIFGSPSQKPCFQELPYGLRSPRNATRGLQSVVQAFIIKHFLFDNRPKEKSIPLDQMLKPTEVDQQTALWTAISEILWNIGERQKVIVGMPGDIPHLQHTNAYFQDGVTEKIYLFEFLSREELQIFIKRYLYHFMEEPGSGALLLLYSAIFTRGIQKVRTDLDAPKGANLLGHSEEGSLNVVTLLLSGRATPYLHNGVVYVGDEDHYALPQFGILSRATIGLLVWEGENEHLKGTSRQPGSRLKTPAYPIWVTCCCGHYGVLFNSNRELLRNYHAEKRFELHYYTCAGNSHSMTVDNRAQDFCPVTSLQRQNSTVKAEKHDEPTNASPLERLIHCKWPEAKVTFHSGAPPNLNY